MAAGSWLWVLRGRGMRHTKNTKGRSEGDDDDVQLDWSKDCAENVREILSNICKKQGISEGRKLGYLNAFVKLLMKYENDFSPLGFTSEEILYCLRPALVHETTQVRAGCLRALRYFLRRKQEAAFCIKLQYPFLIARSLDLVVGNDTERVQALRVIRRLLCINSSDFPVSLVRAVVSVPASYGEDRLLNACLAVLTEICILNPDLFIACGGVTVILRNLTAVKSARMAEALIGALLYLLNKPDTRLKARMNLDCLAAPFTDLHSVDKARDTGQTNESRLKWPHVTLLSMLRSWPGVLHFCHPEREGLRSIVATLYLNQLDVRKAVLDLLYELLCLAQPEWSDEMSVALEAVDPSRSQEAFRLSEGFVAAEGKAVLSHLSKCRVNLSEVHLSLLLYSFLEAGLLDAIVEVIVSEDTFLSVRATILLGELLHLIHLLLPPECCHLTPALPNLLSYAVRGRPTTCRKPLLMSKNKNAEGLLTKATFPIRNDIKLNPYIQDERKKKNSIQHQRLSVRSGHSSARTVSESSTDKVIKLDKPENGKLVDNVLNPLENKMIDEPHDTSVQQQELVSEPTTHLLQDVREVLSDLTYTSNVKSPNLGAKFIQNKPKSVYSTVDRTCTGAGAEYIPHSHYNNITLNVDPPYCSRSQQRALASVSALSKLHRLLRKRPAPASVFLDHVLTSVDHKESLEGMDLARVKGKTLSKNKLAQALTKECEDAIKESGVLSVKDCFAWNWDVIRAILKSRPDCFKKAEDHNQKQFLRRLVQFITPTARQLSRVEIGTDRRTANTFTLAACELIDCLLLGLEESECEKLLSEFLFVLKSEFSSISTAKSAHDCLLSPQNVTNSLCQDYFLLVGHLSRTEAGQVALDKSGILSVLLELAAATNHDCYVKLIISSLDYSRDSMTRMIMTRVLSCKQVSSRLYATKFLHVLLRTPLRKHRDYVSWVIELLVNQLYDENKAISLAAINALDEACDCKEYLEAMINLRPSLLHLGDRGLLLLVRFLSLPQGFSYLCEANFVSNQLQKWATHYNYRYVCIVEGVLSDALTLVEKNEDGRYSSRLSNIKHAPGDVYVPPHLYGQLCQLEVGFNTLVADENISRLCQIIFLGLHNTDNEILELKAALWAIGHMTSSVYGAQWARQQGITKAILQLAQRCPVYSIRAAAFYSISLSATNSEGADTLRAAGWHTVRHNRHERWPVVESLSFLEEAFFQAEEERSVNRDSIGSNEINIEQLTKGGLFFLPEDSTVESDDYFTGFTAREKAFRERKSATLPPTGVQPTYHHNRSYSESKADSDWPNTTSPAQSNSGIDIHDFSDRVVQTLSPIPSSGSLLMVKSQRKTSVSSNYSGQANVRTNSRLSSQDALGYAKLRSLNRSRRPLLSPTPSLSLSFSPSTQVNLSPLSPIELLAFQDWKQMSPLVRPKHCDIQPLSSEFEARGIRWPLLSDAAAARTLHYESSRSCITDSPDNGTAEDMTSYGPCYLGICLPQRLIDLFPDLEPENKFEFIPPIDNNQDLTVGDVSSGDSETDTAPESKETGEGDKPVIKSTRGFMKRRHDRNNCLLCSMSRHGNNKQTRWRKISASSAHRIRTETESSYGGVGNDGESPVMLPWQVRGGLEGVNSVDSSSTDMTSLVQRSLGDTFKSRSVVRKEMLRLAEQLSNPVLYKTCKQALLQLKQVYSDVFNDICVYSDISIVMASAPLRVQSRRFLQELFLDSPFSELYDEPAFILNLPEGEDQSSTEKTNPNQSMDSIPFEEQSTQDPVPCRKCGTKMNGFDTEQRNNQSYELEVIMETDARSECSDICKVENNEDKTRFQAAVQSYQDSEDFPESALDLPVLIECLPVLIKVETLAKDKSVTVQPPDIPEALFQMKTTKSKQQLREEFFAPSVSNKANDSLTKKSPGKSKIVNEKPDLKTNSASKIRSQVEVKPNTTSNSNDQSSIKSTSASSSKRDSSSEEKLPVLKNEIPRNSFKNGKSVENSKENLQSSSKGAKPRSFDSFTTNKNNSTSIGRQRKRATTKTPNRESLETTPRVRRDSDKEDIRRKKPRRVRLTSTNVRFPRPRPKPETTGKVHKLRPNTRLAMVLRQHVRRDNGNGANNKNQFVTFAARQGPKRTQVFQDFMKGLIETKNPTQNSVQFSLALLQNVSPMSDLFADDTRQSSNNGNDNAPNQEAQTDSSNPDILADVETQVSSDVLVEDEPQSTVVAGDNQGDLEGITSNENIDIPIADHTTSHSYNGDNLYSSDAHNHSEEDRKWLQYAVEQLNKEESVYTCILGQMHLNECELGGIRTHTISAEDARQCLLYLSRGDPWDILNLTKIMEKLFIVKTVLKKLQILHKDPLQLERKQIINLLGLYLKKYFIHLKKPLVSTDALLQRHI